MTVTFDPPLTPTGTGTSVVEVAGSAHNCVEPNEPTKDQSKSTGISDFSTPQSSEISDNCTTLIGTDAPDISGGVFSWNPTKKFVASSQIDYTDGQAIEPNSKGHLSVDYEDGSIGAGSFKTGPTDTIYLRAVTEKTETELAEECESGEISSIVLTGSD